LTFLPFFASFLGFSLLIIHRFLVVKIFFVDSTEILVYGLDKVYKPATLSNMDPLLTPKQFQKLLSSSLPYIYKLASTGRIPVVKIPSLGGGREKNLIRFKLEDVRNFINSYYSKEASNG